MSATQARTFRRMVSGRIRSYRTKTGNLFPVPHSTKMAKCSNENGTIYRTGKYAKK